MLATPPLAVSDTGYELIAIIVISVQVLLSCAIPLTAGVARGHVTLGIIGALVALPVAAVLAWSCIGGPLFGSLLGLLIGLIPNVEKPLLSQSEVEQEMRRLRGY